MAVPWLRRHVGPAGYNVAVNLNDLEQLGLELRRLGWKKHLVHARELYAAMREGRIASWSVEHAERLLAVLGLGAHPLPCASSCPRCPRPAPGHWNGVRTMLHLPDRWVSQCSRCGAEWVDDTARRCSVDG